MAQPLAVPLTATVLVQVLSSLAALAGPVLAPLAARELGTAPEAVGLYTALIYLFASTGGLVAGNLIARLGPVRTSQFGLALTGAALLATGAGGLGFALVAAAMIGFAYGQITPASSQILQRIAPPERMNLIFSIKQTGVPAGNFVAGATLPTLALLLGWRGAFMIAGGACLALALAIQPLVKDFDDARDPRRRLLRAGAGLDPLRQVWRTPGLRRMVEISFGYAGMQAALGTFLVVYLNQGIGLDLITAGALLSAAQGAAVPARVIWGIVADRWIAPRRVLIAIGFAMSCAALAIGWVTAAWPVVLTGAVCVVFGASAVAWNGVYLAEIARHSPPGRAGEITGAANFFTFGGVVVVPMLFSLVLTLSASYALCFALAALPCAIGAFRLARARNRANFAAP